MGCKIADRPSQTIASAHICGRMPHKLVVHVLGNVGVAAEILEAVSETIKHEAGVIADGIVDQAVGAAARLLGLYA